jgi:hypothetical protein
MALDLFHCKKKKKNYYYSAFIHYPYGIPQLHLHDNNFIKLKKGVLMLSTK